MRLGVVAALSQELGPTLAAIRSTPRVVDRLRVHESPAFVFAVGGVGSRPAAVAALLLADTYKPQALLSVGFCGALTDELGTADLVLGGTTQHPAEPSLLALAESAAGDFRSGSVLSVPQVVVDREQKKALARSSGARIVDMEAEAVAVAAQARGLGFLAVKTVIDTPSAPLASTYTGCWTVLKDLVLRPASVMGMVYDSKRVTLAATRLREFFLALEKKMRATSGA